MVESKRIEVYYEPKAGEYLHIDHYQKERVSPKEFPDLEVNLGELILD